MRNAIMFNNIIISIGDVVFNIKFLFWFGLYKVVNLGRISISMFGVFDCGISLILNFYRVRVSLVLVLDYFDYIKKSS